MKFMPINRYLKICALGAAVLLSSSLTACVAPILLGGAVVGGTMVATDRRTSGAQLEDEGVELGLWAKYAATLVRACGSM